MALHLILLAVAQQSDIAGGGEPLQQPKSKLLPVILDDAIARIECSRSDKLTLVSATELSPRDPLGLERTQQDFARAETRHPDAVATLRQPAPPNASDENPEAIATFSWGADRLRLSMPVAHSS